jgi:hypothetical protein
LKIRFFLNNKNLIIYIVLNINRNVSHMSILLLLNVIQWRHAKTYARAIAFVYFFLAYFFFFSLCSSTCSQCRSLLLSPCCSPAPPLSTPRRLGLITVMLHLQQVLSLRVSIILQIVEICQDRLLSSQVGAIYYCFFLWFKFIPFTKSSLLIVTLFNEFGSACK